MAYIDLASNKCLKVNYHIIYVVCKPNFLLNVLYIAGKATISNDGATIMKRLDIIHPAAKTLVDIAKSQDAEVIQRNIMHINNQKEGHIMK